MVERTRSIRQLSTSVINKIAAGEVIERPASVLKELLENAVDSGADRIEARLERGGMDRVRVSDNGCGIPPDELPLALASHATSKIETADDLFAVGTLGFRGEALASIAEVSQLLLRSRVHQSPEAHEVTVNGGEAGPIVPCAAAPGTSVDVKNLFFNTPVRRKFLRAVTTELGHATEAFMRIALAYPKIHFLLLHNERTVYDLPPVESWRERIATLFGAEVAESLIWVESDDGKFRLSGYVANPTQSRSHNRMQYLFLNGRHIRDRSLQHALGEAYRGLLLTGRFPISFLRLELPPDQIDVNVHPTKLEVRFQDSGPIYSQMLQAIRSKFLATDLTARVQAAGLPVDRRVDAGQSLAAPAAPTAREPLRAPLATASELAASALPGEDLVVAPQAAADKRAQILDWARGDRAGQAPAADREQHQAGQEDGPGWPPGPSRGETWRPPGADRPQPAAPPISPPQQPSFRFDSARERPFVPFPSVAAAVPAAAVSSPSPPRTNLPGTPSAASEIRTAALADHAVVKVSAIQAHQRYLVTASEDGIMVIDQHALHERILYEQLREKVLAGRVAIQRLLTPEPVDLSPTEAAAVLEHRERLAGIGLEVEGFGGATILVQGYPAMLGKVNPAELLRQVAAELESGKGELEQRDLVDELLHLLSCKAAVKAGDPLTAPEIAALLEFRHLVQDSHHCPHGRPTTLVFTREELDRRFKRI